MRHFLSDCFYAVFGDDRKRHQMIGTWLLVAAQMILMLVALLCFDDDDHNGGRKRKAPPPAPAHPLPVPNFDKEFLRDREPVRA